MSWSLCRSFFVLGCCVLIGTSSCNNQPVQDALATSKLPAFSDAKARSEHYVSLRLATPAGPEAEVAANYTILTDDGGSLSVLAAELSEDGRQVLLMTDEQSESSKARPVASIEFY